MAIERDFVKGMKLLKVLPDSSLPKIDCSGKNQRVLLIMELDSFLDKVSNGKTVGEQHVNTCFRGTLESLTKKNSNAHYYFIAFVNKLLKQGFFKDLGVQVWKSKNNFNQIAFQSTHGQIVFYFDKKFEGNYHRFNPIDAPKRKRESRTVAYS